MKMPKGIDRAPVVLVTGDDESVIRDTVVLIDRHLVGEADRDSCLEELTLGTGLDADASTQITVEHVVAAAQTPAFLTPRRVVVARHLGSLTTKDLVAPLVEYLGNPLETTVLVVVWDVAAGSGVRKGPPPKSLLAAVGECNGVIVDTSRGKKTAEWVTAQLSAESFRLDSAAVARLVDHVGEQPDVLVATLTNLRGSFGVGDVIRLEDLEPVLGVTGDVTPWTLTDAISEGDVDGALTALQRMLVGGGRHPLAVLATLFSYVGNLVALDGAAVTGRDDAARLLGGSPFVATKALAQARRLGSERVADLATLVAQADLDVRRSQLGSELVVEVLVARMASRSGTTRSGPTRRNEGRRTGR